MPADSEQKEPKPGAAAASAETAPAKKTDVVLKYRGGKDGRFLYGVPRSDLTADQVRSIGPALFRHATAGDKPLYSIEDQKAVDAIFSGKE